MILGLWHEYLYDVIDLPPNEHTSLYCSFMKCLVYLLIISFAEWFGVKKHTFFGLFAWTGRLHSCSQADVSSIHHNHINSPRFTTATKSLQSCPTLCNPTDSSPPASSIHKVLHARILQWVAISFSNPNARGCLVTKPCLTLCDLINSSPPGSSVHRIL